MNRWSTGFSRLKPVLQPDGDAMNRPCTCDRPGCRPCRLFRENEAYRQLWGGLPQGTGNPGGEDLRRALPCIFLGEVLDRLNCPCPAKWARRCAIHEVCTLEGCKACEDYEPQ
jgi:hypothetical protein